MKTLLIAATLLTTQVWASQLSINTFYRLNSQDTRDRAAEICFSLKPAPTSPQYAQIIIDKGSRYEGYYSAWVGPKGSVCHVVSTLGGRAEVSIPSLNIQTKSALK
jgi:hypothetical protein